MKLNSKNILNEMKKGKEFIDINSMNFISSKSYGIYYVVSQLLEKYGLDEILKSNLSKGKHQFDVYAVIKALIINRLENPLSKNKAFEYIKKDYPEEINCIKDNLYSAMDVLEDKKEKLEKEFFPILKDKLKLNLENTHYDITSSYFEGHKCDIATYGYSRDHRNDREQIVIGLVLVDGIPIYHEVFKGNTQDKTTVLTIVKTLEEKFNLNKPTIVGDRGMFSKNIVENLEKEKKKYLLGFSKPKNKITEELFLKNMIIPKNEDHYAILGKEEIIKYSTKNIQKRRYILCIDKNTQTEQLNTLENVKTHIFNNLTKLKSKFDESQNSNKGKKAAWENFIINVKKITNRNKNLFELNYDHKNQKFDFKLNEQWYQREQKAAGKFVLITNTDKMPLEALKTYKELNTVESSFNCIKNQLNLRPVNHYKTERVKAHIFICVLALLIEKIMSRNLKNISAQCALDELKRMKIGNFQFGKIKKKNLTEISFEQKEIFNLLNLIKPII